MTEADIIGLLQRHERLTANQLRELVGDVNISAIRRSLRSLRRFDIIQAEAKQRTEGKMTFHYFEYSLKDDGATQ